MKEVSGKNFGLLIAYVLPGFVGLWGVSHFSQTVGSWLVASSSAAGNAATVGGFLYVTLASVGAGLTASTIRWAAIDRLHNLTGIKRPCWDDSRLHERLEAFEALVENHYRYYQFYGNMLVAMLFLFAARLAGTGRHILDINVVDCAILAIGALYWAGSRDALRNYYSRTEVLLGTREREVDNDERALHGDSNAEEPEGGGEEPSDGEGSSEPQGG
jgi:hypothetical protein